MAIKTTICALVATVAMGLSGCEENPSRYITGKVLKESGTIVDRQRVIERSEGALFGNESVKLADPTYAIKIKADDGKVYTFAINPRGESYRLEALNLSIDQGTRVKITKGGIGYELNGPVGEIYHGDLKVLPDK